MGRPKNIANTYDAPKSNTNFSEGAKSKGILDDSPVRSDIHTKEFISKEITTDEITTPKLITGDNSYIALDEIDLGFAQEPRITAHGTGMGSPIISPLSLVSTSMSVRSTDTTTPVTFKLVNSDSSEDNEWIYDPLSNIGEINFKTAGGVLNLKADTNITGDLTITGSGTIPTTILGSATGVSATATDGKITFTSLKAGGFNESLWFDMDLFSNIIGIGSDSGAVAIGFRDPITSFGFANGANFSGTGVYTSTGNFYLSCYNGGYFYPLKSVTAGTVTDTLVLETGICKVLELAVTGESIFKDKIIFTQTDGNEYIDSLNDGYIDIGATTGIRLNANTNLGANDLTTTGTGTFEDIKTQDIESTDALVLHVYPTAAETPTFSFGIGGTSRQCVIQPNTASIHLDGNVLPFSDNTEDLGASTYRWVDAYFSGDIEINVDNKSLKMGATSTDLQISSNGTQGVISTTDDLNISCGTDKTLELQESVYRDINIAGYLLAKPASSAPDLATFVDEAGDDTTIETYGFAVGEKVHGGFELQHDYKQGTNLVFHVHWNGNWAPSGTDYVQWRLTYIVMRDGATLDAAVTIDSPDTAFDTQYETVRSDFAAITGTNFLIGDQFMFTLSRVAATGDEYVGDALIATAGIHYEVDTIGSRQITIK